MPCKGEETAGETGFQVCDNDGVKTLRSTGRKEWPSHLQLKSKNSVSCCLLFALLSTLSTYLYYFIFDSFMRFLKNTNLLFTQFYRVKTLGQSNFFPSRSVTKWWNWDSNLVKSDSEVIVLHWPTWSQPCWGCPTPCHDILEAPQIPLSLFYTSIVLSSSYFFSLSSADL